MQIQINTPQEVKQLLLKDKLSPSQAIHYTQIMMSLMQIKVDTTNPNKEVVANQIDTLLKLNKPLSFWQTTNDFNVKEVFKCK